MDKYMDKYPKAVYSLGVCSHKLGKYKYIHIPNFERLTLKKITAHCWYSTHTNNCTRLCTESEEDIYNIL